MAVHMGELTVNCHACLRGRKTECEFNVPGQEVWEFYGEEYRGCPLKHVTRVSAAFLRAFTFFERGFLPNEGGWLNQPAKLLDAFDVIEKEVSEVNRAEKQKKRMP